MFVINSGNKIVWINALAPRVQLDGRSMCIIRAHINNALATRTQKSNIDVRLDIFDEMAEVNAAIGIGQRAGDECLLSQGLTLPRDASGRPMGHRTPPGVKKGALFRG